MKCFLCNLVVTKTGLPVGNYYPKEFYPIKDLGLENILVEFPGFSQEKILRAYRKTIWQKKEVKINIFKENTQVSV